MNRITFCVVAILLSALIGARLTLAASCTVYAIERPKEDNWFNENTRKAVKAAGNTVVEFTNLTDLRDKIAQHMASQSPLCDCISELILGGHGQAGKFSVGCGKYKNCAKTEYIGTDNYADWTPVLANIGKLMCDDGLISEGIRLWGCEVGVCTKGSQLLHDIAQVTASPVHAATITVSGSKFLEELESDNWQVGLPNAPARQPCKVGTVLQAKNRKRGAGTYYQCPCDGTLYEDLTECTNKCKVSLGCFTNICIQVYVNTYLDSSDGNPVLSGTKGSAPTQNSLAANAASAWDAGGVSTPTVVKENGGYKMWFTGYDATDTYWRIGLAESPYGQRWTKAAQKPVLTEDPAGSWDAGGAYNPCVIRDGSLYRMWYQGFSDWSRIGYAESADGVSWSKHPQPVLNLGPAGSPDEYGVGEPTVLKEGNEFKMWYGCYDGWQWRICLASSPDGRAWTRQPDNPVLDVGPEWAWDEWFASAPAVVKMRDGYVMYYGGVDWYEKSRIGRATSRDGVHWTKDPNNPILLPDGGRAWESGGVTHPALLSDDNEALLKLWYRGTDGSDYAVGFATLPQPGAEETSVPTSMPGIPLLLLLDD